MSTRLAAAVILGGLIAIAGMAQGQSEHGEETKRGMGHGMMQGGHGMHHAMPMPGGMMRGGMMMGMCQMMSPDVSMKVENTKDGVTIRLFAPDEKAAKRLQLRAEIAQLMHELRGLEMGGEQ